MMLGIGDGVGLTLPAGNTRRSDERAGPDEMRNMPRTVSLASGPNSGATGAAPAMRTSRTANGPGEPSRPNVTESSSPSLAT